MKKGKNFMRNRLLSVVFISICFFNLNGCNSAEIEEIYKVTTTEETTVEETTIVDITTEERKVEETTVANTPYEQLGQDDKEFVDYMSGFYTKSWFTNPEKVTILGIEKFSDGWGVNIDDGEKETTWLLNTETSSWDSFDGQKIEHNSLYNLELINEALQYIYKQRMGNVE